MFEASWTQHPWGISCTKCGRLILTFDIQAGTSIRSSSDQGLSNNQVWSFWGKAFMGYMYPLHKVWETDMSFDLELWPTDLNINRIYLLQKDYLPTKFKTSRTKRSRVISCTRCGRRSWPFTLSFDLLTWISIGIIYSPRPIYLPILKLLCTLPFMFEASWANQSWVFSYSRCGSRTWPLTLTFDLLIRITNSIIYSSRTLCIPTECAGSGTNRSWVWETNMNLDLDLWHHG